MKKKRYEESKANREVAKMTVTNMYEVFSHELADVYDAEHRLLEDRKERVQSVSNQELLGGAMQDDLDNRSEGRIENVEKAFRRLGEQPWRETCQATQGLIEEAQSGIGEAEGGPVRDLLINAAMIKEELYKSAAYRNLINSVQSLEGGGRGCAPGRPRGDLGRPWKRTCARVSRPPGMPSKKFPSSQMR